MHAAGAESVYRSYHSLLTSKGFSVFNFFGTYSPQSGFFRKTFAFPFIISHLTYQILFKRCVPDIVIVHNFASQLTALIFYYFRFLSFILHRKIVIFHVLHDYALITPSSGFFYFTRKHILSNFPTCRQGFLSRFLRCADNRSFAHDLYKKIRWFFTFLLFRPFLIDSFLAPSPFISSVTTTYFPSISSFVLYNPLSSSPPSNCITESFESSQFSLAFLGRDSIEKGLDVLIDELSIFNFSDRIELFTSLSAEKYKHYQEILHSAHVYLHGFLGRSSLHQKLSLCSCVVVPSIWYENAPLVVIEALSLGLIVFVRDIGSLSSFADSSNNIFKYSSPNELSDLIFKYKSGKIRFDQDCPFLKRFLKDHFLSSFIEISSSFLDS